MEHKVKKIKVYPREPIEWSKGVYIGMSMNNTIYKSHKSIEEVINEIDSHIDECYVLVGDFLHRYNEQIFHGHNLQDAINISMSKGENLVQFFKDVIEKLKIDNKYKFIHSGEFLNREAFQKRLKEFKELYDTHARFRELIDHTVCIYLRRQNEIKIPIKKAEELCKEYLFEELIIFEYLAQDGLMVNIYPGNQLPIMKALVSGKLSGVSDILEKIQAIEIKFRPS